ncbi:transcriptional regulator GcvA [Chromobacterium haemolyticum]|uniref:Transcriptional regulator GcvA n=1 Tax=Chromobacterium fluminis TaxID=3044269 RepID=A0ABX0L2W4_9NEIS|nr:transcriptional regulator GcvA [Chromobacterium haemolyticum]NHR05150.1 transcriptional regulator GcvA [Chromobacterium haemolyticum]
MYQRLPPLHALKVFESAARHMSFTRAAEELFVTKAAISHQIKQLEQFLNQPLFERQNNRLKLTMAGEHYLPRIREIFRTLQQATDRLMLQTTPALNIHVPRLFGSKWLIPRLYRFLKRHPALPVEIHAEPAAECMAADIVISTGPPWPPRFHTEPFVSTAFFPVCSPALARDLRQPQDLARCTLLHEQQRHAGTGWRQWLDQARLKLDLNAQPSLSFSDESMLLQAAIDGQGVALGQALCVEYDLLAGRLARPLHGDAPFSQAYYLSASQHENSQPAVLTLRDWLFEEATVGAPAFQAAGS